MNRNEPIIQMYLALADTGTLTEPEGRQKVKEFFPSRAHEVDDLVRAFEAEAMGKTQMDVRMRAGFEAMRRGSSVLEPIGSQDMNAGIRAAANKGRIDPGN